eukprot:UN01492
MNRQIHCETYCGCGQECLLQWRGCRCGTGRCRTRACPCFVAMRECNPDICVGCQSYLTPSVHNKALHKYNLTGEEEMEIDGVPVAVNNR